MTRHRRAGDQPKCEIASHVAARDRLLAPLPDCRQYAPAIGSETNGEQRLGSGGQQRDGRSRRRFADHASQRPAGEDRDHRLQAAGHAARPGARLFARRRRALHGNLPRSEHRLRLHDPRQPGGRHLQRHRRAGAGRHRRAGRQAGDGGQGRPVQALRRRRLHRPRGRHQGRRPVRQLRALPRADLRRHQPRGHQGAGVLHHRAAPARADGHPDLP